MSGAPSARLMPNVMGSRSPSGVAEVHVQTLLYGIVVTHVSEPNYGWAIPVAFV
jgi:hypothetical protein